MKWNLKRGLLVGLATGVLCTMWFAVFWFLSSPSDVGESEHSFSGWREPHASFLLAAMVFLSFGLFGFVMGAFPHIHKPREACYYDDEIKDAIRMGLPNVRIQELFPRFVPSLTLDYTAPAQLGLAAYICARRPDLLAVIFRQVARNYFQLGVETDSDFKKFLEWEVLHNRDILTRHGDADAPEWLQQNFERYRETIHQRLAELVEELRKEDEDRQQGRFSHGGSPKPRKG